MLSPRRRRYFGAEGTLHATKWGIKVPFTVSLIFFPCTQIRFALETHEAWSGRSQLIAARVLIELFRDSLLVCGVVGRRFGNRNQMNTLPPETRSELLATSMLGVCRR